jgi:hypothetical protein
MDFLIPPWVKFAAIGVLVVAIFGSGWYLGAEHIQARVDKQAVIDTKAHEAETTRLAKVEQVVVYKYIDKYNVVHDQGQAIIKEVPKYVTKKADANCTITSGFVRVFDAAAANIPLPEAARTADETISGVDTDSGVKLSEVEDIIGRDFALYHLMKVQCESLQDWVRGVTTQEGEK